MPLDRLPVGFLDTGAPGRALLGEPNAPAILRDIRATDQRIASRLLGIELNRLAQRHGALAGRSAPAGVALLPVDEDVSTLDAIHLVTTLRPAAAGRRDAI